jgi:DNA-binding transcriptional ArsR family regulator
VASVAGSGEKCSLIAIPIVDNILVFGKIPKMNLVFKALADPTRRAILELLRQRERTAGELAQHFTLSKPTLSGHFAVLREADLVMTEKSGTTVTYRLNLSVLEEALMGFASALGIGSIRGNHHDN